MACTLFAGIDGPGVCRVRNACHMLRGSLCDACTKIKAVEEDISAVRCSLERLLRKHRELRTEMNRNHDPFVVRAPPEVMSTIFEFCFPSNPWPTHTSRSFPSYVSDRLRLGQVCREWRSIAQSTHLLWTDLAVRVDSELPWQTDFIREWLIRSGTLPLTIRLYSRPNFASSSTCHDYRRVKAFVNVLNDHSHRWQTLEVVNVPAALSSWLTGNSSSTSILRILHLSVQTVWISALANLQSKTRFLPQKWSA